MTISRRSLDGEDEVGPLLAQASEHLKNNDLGQARDLLEQALVRDPKNGKVQGLLGLTCFKQGAHQRAAELYETLVRDNPVDATLHINLGLALLKLGEPLRAAKEFQAAVDLAPEHKKAHSYLGVALAQAGEPAAAREAFVAAGSTAMVEKMDQVLAGQARPNTHAHVRATFAELEGQEASSAEPPRPDASRLNGAHPPAPAPPVAPSPVRPPSAVQLTAARAPSTSAPAVSAPAPSLALADLAQALRIDSNAMRPDAPPFDVRGNVVAVKVAGEVLTRMEPLLSILGTVQLQPEMKRFRGRATDKPFGKGARRFMRASGQGALLIGSAGRHMLPLEIGDSAVYFCEEMLFAFEEPLTFENGRLPGKNGSDLNLVHLRGRGKALLALPGPLRSVAVGAEVPTSISLDQLVGWVGALTPRLVTPVAEADGEAARLAVELSGEGFALVTVPEQITGHVRTG